MTQREGGLGYPTSSTSPTVADGAKVFFANTGTEANEGALKVARKVGKARGGNDKFEIVCFEQSFHGRSLGALSITANRKYQDPFAPLLPGVRVGKLNVREGLEDLIGEKTCAVVLEPIQGEGGVNAAQVDWVREVVRRAREVGAVVIFDEIQVCSIFPIAVGGGCIVTSEVRGCGGGCSSRVVPHVQMMTERRSGEDARLTACEAQKPLSFFLACIETCSQSCEDMLRVCVLRSRGWMNGVDERRLTGQ